MILYHLDTGGPIHHTVSPRYWGSYSAVYPAGGGGNSGALALDLADLQEQSRAQGRALDNRAPSPRVQETRCRVHVTETYFIHALHLGM